MAYRTAPRPSFNGSNNHGSNDDPLTAALMGLIPANETPQQREQRLALETEARKISDAIDERLRQERIDRGKRVVKLLLLGQSESGKSTVLKNMQLVYAPSSLRAELATWRAIIHLNLLRSLKVLVESVLSTEEEEDANARVTDDHRRLILRLSPLKQAEALLRQRITIPEDETNVVVANSEEFAVRSAAGWREAFLRMRGRGPNRDSGEDKDNQPAVILEACAPDMIALWNDPVVKDILKQKKLRLEDTSGFFLNDIERVAKRDYTPHDDDVLRARLPTIGVQEHKIMLEKGPERGQSWYIFDVGGARSQRAAWEPFFDDVNAIIFLAPISTFDQSLAEDKRVNRVEDSLLLWKNICQSRLLAKVELIIFLNKCDLLAKKLEAGIRLAKYVPSFKDYSNDWDTVTRYFRAKFKAIQKEYSPETRSFYGHLTSVTDAESTAVIVASVRETIVKANLTSANVL